MPPKSGPNWFCLGIAGAQGFILNPNELDFSGLYPSLFISSADTNTPHFTRVMEMVEGKDINRHSRASIALAVKIPQKFH